MAFFSMALGGAHAMDPVKSISESLIRNTPVYFKMGALFFLVLILLIPINMVESVIDERQGRQRDATREIGNIWGREQGFFGPVLIVPYQRFYSSQDEDGAPSISRINGRAYFLPESLSISADIQPEIRHRGIFESVVYRVDSRFSGNFARPDLTALEPGDIEIHWDQAIVALGVNDLRGATGELKLKFGEDVSAFAPGSTSDVLGGGIHAPVGQMLASGWQAGETIPFSFSVDVAGSGGLGYTPVAKETTVDIRSPWPHPSFRGAWLPNKYTTGPDGFEAHWQVSYFGRDFPQQWTDSDSRGVSLAEGIVHSQFGVALISPVGFYQKSERTVKYAMLFVLLIFATIFILEVAVPMRVHLFQYMLVGFAMTIFYLLLLALSEVIGFASAYGVAALTATAMISLYLGKVMRSLSRSAMVAAILALVYGFLYIVLQLEQYALLTGTLGVVVALAAVMYATRNIDWYRLTHAEPRVGKEEPPGGD